MKTFFFVLLYLKTGRMVSFLKEAISMVGARLKSGMGKHLFFFVRRRPLPLVTTARSTLVANRIFRAWRRTSMSNPHPDGDTIADGRMAGGLDGAAVRLAGCPLGQHSSSSRRQQQEDKLPRRDLTHRFLGPARVAEEETQNGMIFFFFF